MTEAAGSPLDDDDYVAWLAAHDDAVAARVPAICSRDSAGLPPERRQRLELDGAWCEFVRAAWTSPGDSPSADARLSPADDNARTRFGRFEILRELGRGAHGVVFLAYDPRLRRQVALKLPRPEVMVTAEMRVRFEREARAAAVLDHPNLVPVFDTGEDGSISYIASAYCAGPTLSAWLKGREEPVPPRLAARIVLSLARAIAHAHRRGVLHRDLKPGNVILEPLPDGAPTTPDRDGFEFNPRVTDFGLARLTAVGPEVNAATQTGEILGTPSYMSPEQADGRAPAIGPTTDVYGLGAILYSLLTGRPPFQAHSPLDTLLLLRTQEPIAPSRLRPRLPRDLETVCLKCLHKSPHKRYVSALALADDLDRFLDGKPVVARRVGSAARFALWCRREPALVATIAVALLAITAVASFGFWRVVRERDRAEARRLEAVDNLRQARGAVDRMLTRVSEEKIRGVPQLEPIRRALLEDALGFYRDFARRSHDDPEVVLEVIQAYGRVGRVYDEFGRKDEAEHCFLEALGLENQLIASFPTMAVYRLELARTQIDLGNSWGFLGTRKVEAIEILRKSIAALETLNSTDPREPKYRISLCAAHEILAITLAGEGRAEEAEAGFRRVIGLADDLVTSFPDDAGYPVRAMNGRSNLAELLMERGRLAEAEAMLGVVLEFWERLVQREPAASLNRSRLANTLEGVAQVLEKRGRKPEREQALRRAMELRLGLSKDFPDTTWQHGKVAQDLALLAQLASDRGDFALARELQQRAVASRRAALAIAPKNADFAASTRKALAALIETLIRLRDHEQATKAITELTALSAAPALECFQAGLFQAQCVPMAAADLTLPENRRSELATRYADRAIELLRDAVNRGNCDVEALKKDPSFEPLRSRTDFAELLAGAVGRSKGAQP